jgi:hypothetical protein
MITPALSLDFTTGVLDPRISFARAGNTATVKNSSGAIVLVNADTPRFDYSAGSPQKLLIEETRTNLLTNSVLDGAVTGTPGTQPTGYTNGRVTGAISAIAASNYAAGFELTIACSSQRRTFYKTFSVAANTSYTFSLDIEFVSGSPSTRTVATFADLYFGPAGSTLAYYVDGTLQSGSYNLTAGNRYFIEVVLTVAATAGIVEAHWGVGLPGDRIATANFRNLQFEVGNRSTSYIPTTATALTRNADAATITGANFSGFWEGAQGGVTAQAVQSSVSGICPLIQFDDGTADNIIAMRGNTTNPELYIVDGGTPQAQIDAGTIAANTAYSLTGWWQTNFCAARKDNGARVEDLTATIPTVTQARLGSDGTNYLNGHLATINYYDQFSGQIYTRRKNKAVFTVI